MRLIALILALCSTLAFAAPSVASSQFVAFTGPNPSVAIQSGAVGDRIYIIAAWPQANAVTGPLSGWYTCNGGWSAVGTQCWFRTSDGTETSATLPLNSVSGQAVVLRVSGQAFPIPYLSASGTGGPSNPPDAPQGPVNPLPSVPFLHLTVAAVNGSAAPVLSPSGYSNILYSAANGVGLMVSEKSDNGGAVENAGPWTLDASATWRAQTISTR